MSSYLVLARKYRPKQFSDIVGQQSVVRTLVNAMKLKRTHQAYVFSGSRGIGKTSIARIFSKALRCQNVVERDGLLYSCDQCSDCIEIAAGNSVNVLEIDGASNNGVDSVREIRENAKFLPTSGTYKIYIIDEVHMLSTAAFNALLKTLEEPPEHVVFIFATTESHKIPETILGRCQRFDFKRVTVAEITQRMREILKSEKIDSDEAALNLIARAAEGSMRDALSILDQVISFSGMKITAQAVRESIGLIGTELVYALLKNIVERNAKDGLIIVQGAFTQGVDLKTLLKVVIEMMHALILMQVGIDKPETHFNDDELKQIASLKNTRPLEENELIFQVLHHGLDLLSRAAQPKLIFDMLVIKTALAEALVKVEDLIDDAPKNTSIVNDRGSPRPPVADVVAPLPLPLPAEEKKAFSLPNFNFNSTATKADAKAGPVISAGVDGPKSWEGFIGFCDLKAPAIGVILESVVENALPSENHPVLRLGFRERDQTKVDQVNFKAFKDQVIHMIELYFGTRATIETFFSQITGESVAEKSERNRKEARDQRMQSILSSDVIQEAKALFGADLTNIELLEKES
jgi:DNA polymerase-3 subunit gamma/tau